MVDGVKKWIRLHRYSLGLAVGPPPDGKPLALHSCHNPRCVNPLHLRWGNHTDNNREREDCGRGRKSRMSLDQVIMLSNVRGKERQILAVSFGISYGQSRALVREYRAGNVQLFR
jgi:hypothetical protein